MAGGVQSDQEGSHLQQHWDEDESSLEPQTLRKSSRRTDGHNTNQHKLPRSMMAQESIIASPAVLATVAQTQLLLVQLLAKSVVTE